MVETIGRVDLPRRIQDFSITTDGIEPEAKLHDLVSDEGRNDNDHTTKERDPCDTVNPAGNKDGPGDMVTDGVGDGEDTKSSPVNTTDTTEGSSLRSMETHPASLPAPLPAPLPASVGQQTEPTQVPSSTRFQLDPAIEPEPARYVNFLFYEGYSVEILGGKHFKTRDGEFVEVKSGTQYKILVKNSHTYGCHLDISIDGYDIGGWALHGGEEMSIERSAYEAKRFTFYRVKSAPKEAGIESGRPENGLVKCVFTPEAFLNIPVITSDSSQPLNVSIPPSATVGELKHEVQSQMEVRNDPDQVLALDDKVLPNASLVNRVLRTPGNLRLIDAEMTISVTVETSSKVSYPKTFPIKVHPGRSKVHDLMQQIERRLNVPVSDQKLYFGKTLLSGAPRECLPDKLICSPRPAVAVILPEYIHITVEEQNGDSHALKIDKEKNLEAVMEEIPSCCNLQENTQVIFYFNEKKIFPFKNKRNLDNLGICSGSRLELKMKIFFIDVEACFSGGSPPVRVRCSPQDTFHDLMEKIGVKNEKKKWKFTFAMDTRIFDPDEDKSPLQDYGVTHGCTLHVAKHLAADGSIMAHETSKCNGQEFERGGLSDVPGDRKGKKSFFRNVKEKLFGKRLEECTSDLTHGGDSPPLLGLSLNKSSSNVASSMEPDPGWRSGGTTLQGHSTQEETYGSISEEEYSLEEMGEDNSEEELSLPRYGAIPNSLPQCGAILNSESRTRVKTTLAGIRRCAVISNGRFKADKATLADPPVGAVIPRSECRARKVKMIFAGPPPCGANPNDLLGFKEEEGYEANRVNVVESDPEWRSGGTTLQGQSTQRFITAEPIRVDPSKKIELVLRLVAREGEEGLKFPEGKCTPLSTLIPPAVQE